MKRIARFGFGLAFVLALGGCASVDAKNSDSRPWNRPAPAELNPSFWSWLPGLVFPCAQEEQEWLRSRENFGR